MPTLPRTAPTAGPRPSVVTVAVDLGCAWCGLLHPDWECPICGGRPLRAPVVGADRTAEELGRAFPNTVIRQSGGGGVLAEVPSTPALVVATPGAEPVADGGLCGCGAAATRPAAAPGRSAGRRGGAAPLAGRGRAGPSGRRRRLGDRGGGQRGPGSAGPGPAGSGRLRGPRARRAGRGALPARGQGGDRGRRSAGARPTSSRLLRAARPVRDPRAGAAAASGATSPGAGTPRTTR